MLRGWRDLTAAMPGQLTTLANILIAPPVPFLPEAVHGQLVVGILGVYAGNVEDGAKAAQPLRTLGEPLADLMGPMPYTAMQSLLDPLWTAGAQNYFTGAFVGGLTDETIDTLLARHACGRAPVRELHLHHCGGAMARVPAAATAFAHRNAAYVLNIIARSPEREGFPEHVGWARATHQAVDPWTTGGAYVNFTSESGADKVQASYPPDTYARLVAVKDRYDPTNRFRSTRTSAPPATADQYPPPSACRGPPNPVPGPAAAVRRAARPRARSHAGQVGVDDLDAAGAVCEDAGEVQRRRCSARRRLSDCVPRLSRAACSR